jgi:transposase
MLGKNRYSVEFKKQAVELVRLGKPVKEVSEELGISTGMLYRWVSKSQKLAAGENGAASPEEQTSKELRRLRKENARLHLENDILKKAAVILGINPSMNVVR